MLIANYDKNYITNFYVEFYLKYFIFFKYTFVNFFFLVNKTIFITFFYSFSINHLIKKEIILINYKLQDNFMLQIKKSHRFHFKKFRIYKLKFKRNKYAFKRFLKFSKFFKYIFLNNVKLNSNLNLKKKISILNNVKFHPKNFFRYRFWIYRNWKFLTGNLISPYYWDFLMQKKWIRKKIIFFLLLNRSRYYKRNRLTLYIRTHYKATNNKIISRKLYLNNFLYFNQANIRVKDLNYFIKIKTSKTKKANLERHLTRPYLFLNRRVKGKRIFTNATAIRLYRKYIKIFIAIKRSRFKFWKIRDIVFKNFNFKKKKFFKIRLRKSYFRFQRIKKRFFFFHFKNFFCNINNLPKPIKKTRMLLKPKYKRFFIIRTKFLIKFFWFLFLKNKIRSKYKSRYRFRYKHFFKYKTKSKFNIKFKIKRKFAFIRLKFNNFSRLQKYKLIKIDKKLKYFFLPKLKKKIKKIIIFTTLNFFSSNFNKFRWTKKKFNFFLRYKTLEFKMSFYKYSYISSYIKHLWFKNKILKLNFVINSFSIKKQKNSKNFKKRFRYWTSCIYRKMKYSIFVTKKKTPFLLNKYGFMFLSEFLFKNIFFNQTLCNFKKKLYSFSYKNEFHRYILRKYMRRHSIINLIPKWNHQLSPIKTTLLRWKINNNKIWEDVNIKRIRFKPGYMTLWRDARQVLKLSLNLKMQYQYKLTSYLAKYNKFIKIKTFLMFEMQLSNILLKSRMLPDLNTTNLFIENNLVYINGIICNKFNFQIFTGDFIQILISLKYYILHKWFLNWELKKTIRLRHIAKKKLITRYSSDEKTKSYLLPKWILFSKNSFSDVSKYLEIDYFTLSILILYEPFLWSDINPFTFVDTKFGVINLYNWKYIT